MTTDTPTRQYKFDNFELDLPKRRLLRDGKVIALNPKAFDLLAVLVEHNGELLTKDDLFRLVWDEQIVEESNLTVNMSAIRRALGEKASEPRYITTVSGRGYYFTADLKDAAIENRQEKREEDLVVESHSISRIVLEQESDELDEIEKIAQLPAKAALPPAPESFFRKNQTAIIGLSVLAAILIIGGSFLFQALKNPLPFQQISVKRLTTNGKVTNAALAPDGNLFVYSRQEADGRQSLWLEHSDGGEERQIVAPAEVSFLNLEFAPDGSRLYYQIASESAERGALYKMPILGGLSEKVRENLGNPIAFAPDGKQFAFVRLNNNTRQSEIVIADSDGANEQTLITRPGNLGIVSSSLAWSRDGKLIAFAANNDESGTNQEVFTTQTDDGTIEQITNLSWNNARALVWTKDGSGLYAVAGAKDATWESQIWHISHPNGEARRIVTDLISYSSILDMSADGNELLAFQAQQLSNIWVAPADNLAQARQITFDSLGQLKGWNGLDWTPDGRIVVTGFVGRSETLWALNADGSNPKQIIPENRISNNLSLSDDGRVLIFDSNRSGSTEIWRADGDGANLRQLTTGGRNSQPHVSPDGKLVVYRSSREGTGALWSISTEGGEPIRITEKSAEWARFSPDGKMIAYGFNADGKTKIAVISSEGGEPFKSFDVPRTANLRLGIHWTPDGAGVTYRDWANGIWKQPLDGGEPQRLEGLPAEKLYAYGWSRDGKQFAFSRGTEIRDVVLINQRK
jgi:Tol biopolymer transport system component/DNA-binding winged helix-turn-helix (wHTH) protein